MKKLNTVLLTSAAIIALVSTAVNAEGFIAGALRDIGVIDEGQRKQLDGAHKALGNPLDHMARGAATYYAPGSVQAYDSIRNRNNRFQRPAYVPPRLAQPMPMYHRPPMAFQPQPFIYGTRIYR